VIELNHRELQRDLALAACALEQRGETRYSAAGAHDPTASRYFVLEQLFSYFNFDETSHLLDVGCANGRVLAYFAQAGFPGRATGVELDPELAARARSWSESYPQLSVLEGDVLGVDLAAYTDFYLFNPFDQYVLERFIEKLESEARASIKLCHMSDNGDTYCYLGRPGWSLIDQGWIREHEGVSVFSCAQHWSVWSFNPCAAPVGVGH